MPLVTTEHDEIRRRFAADQLIVNQRGWPRFFVGFVSFGLGAFLTARFGWRIIGGGLAVIGFVTAAAGLMIVTRHSRCPHCDEVLRTRRGLLVNPAECPHCGVGLR